MSKGSSWEEWPVRACTISRADSKNSNTARTRGHVPAPIAPSTSGSPEEAVKSPAATTIKIVEIVISYFFIESSSFLIRWNGF